MKRRTTAILAAALVLLLATAGAALAQAEIPWWVIGGGGSESGGGGGGGSVIIDDTIGQPVIGPSAGGAVNLDAGYRQQRFGPAAITDVSASIAAGPLLLLEWTAVTQDTAGHAISGVTYDVYCGQDDPYFTPGTACETGLTSPTFDDAGVIGDTTHFWSYVVRAVWGGLSSANSNRTGAFAFPLTPGS